MDKTPKDMFAELKEWAKSQGRELILLKAHNLETVITVDKAGVQHLEGSGYTILEAVENTYNSILA